MKTAYGYGTVVPNKVVAAAPVTIRPLKNVVQMQILLISAILIKLAVKALVATLTRFAASLATLTRKVPAATPIVSSVATANAATAAIAKYARTATAL